MQFLAIYLYVMAVGFVAARGLVELRPARLWRAHALHRRGKSILDSLAGVLLRVLAGPAILMRNAWRGQIIQRRPKIWFGVSALIAALWSLFSGALLLDLIVKL